MPDVDDVQDGKNYHFSVPMQASVFFLKGSNSLDWGMKNRLARIFNPATGKAVMLAVDHGYFQGPTTGLERIDVSIVPLVLYADALMITRGALRTSIPAEMSKPVVLRSSGGQSILKEPLERAGGRRHRGCRAAQRLGHGRAGIYRRRA